MMANSEEEIWKERIPCVLGIDEAGRGPVLGPMVYTAAYCPKECLKALNALGADDSKQLTEEQRESLRVKIDNAGFLRSKTCVLSAQEISEKMLRKVKYNLNLISHDTALQLVEEVVAEGINVEEVYVDTVGNPESYAKKFRDRFPQIKKVVVAKKADATYRIVGAASIVAKTTRDRQIRDWNFVEEERSSSFSPNDSNMAVKFCGPLGSGYPSDPITKAWMQSNCDNVFGYPNFVRFSWGTSKTVLDKHAVRVEWYVGHTSHGSPFLQNE